MSFYCNISGEPPRVGVINPQSGYVYEKSLLEKYFRENGNKDPITGQVLDNGIEAVVEIKRGNLLSYALSSFSFPSLNPFPIQQLHPTSSPTHPHPSPVPPLSLPYPPSFRPSNQNGTA
jgi:hypothetical protein